MNVNYTLLDRGIEAKVEAALIAEAKRTGREVSDLTEADFARLAESIFDDLSENEIDRTSYQGVKHIVAQVVGEKIAAEIWNLGFGIHATNEQVLAVGRKLRVAEDDIRDCYVTFMETVGEMTLAETGEFPTLAKFAPLFDDEPEDVALAEVAERKAAEGNKLAMSFLAWKEIE